MSLADFSGYNTTAGEACSPTIALPSTGQNILHWPPRRGDEAKRRRRYCNTFGGLATPILRTGYSTRFLARLKNWTMQNRNRLHVMKGEHELENSSIVTYMPNINPYLISPYHPLDHLPLTAPQAPPCLCPHQLPHRSSKLVGTSLCRLAAKQAYLSSGV